MNLNLLQQNFTQNYPDEFDGVLEASNAVVLTVSFNRRGTLLAGGCNDGKILIWDFITRGLSKVILGHSHPVARLDWTRCGYFLCSTGADNYINVWKILTGECVYSFRSTIPVLTTIFCPRYYERRFYRGKKASAVNLPNRARTESQRQTKLPHLLVQPLQTAPRVVDTEMVVAENSVMTKNCIIELKAAIDEGDVNFCVSWNRRGTKLFVGNGRGKIFVFKWEEMVSISKSREKQPSIWEFRLCATFRVTQPAPVRLIEFAKKGSKLVIVTDKVIRMYQEDMIIENHTAKNTNKRAVKGGPDQFKELVPIHNLKDQISRQSWRVCCFSGDGEYICAGQVKQNNLFLYETDVKSDSVLVKNLVTRGGDTFTDVVWHPLRPIICTLTSGEVSVYTHNYIENWSAFAPDFEELEENRIYMERESEFDESDEDKSIDDGISEASDLSIDIIGEQKARAYWSSDEEQETTPFLEYLPMSIDQIEQGVSVNTIPSTAAGSSSLQLDQSNRSSSSHNSTIKNGLGIANHRTKAQKEAAASVIAAVQQVQDGDLDKSISSKKSGASGGAPAIEFDFGTQSDSLIHPLLIPSMKASRAAKRKQEKLAAQNSEASASSSTGTNRKKRSRATD